MRVCTSCKTKFSSGSCPKCRSYANVVETSNPSSSYTTYETSSYSYDGGSSYGNDSCSDSSSSGGDSGGCGSD